MFSYTFSNIPQFGLNISWIFKVIKAVSVVIWMEIEPISPVCVCVMSSAGGTRKALPPLPSILRHTIFCSNLWRQNLIIEMTFYFI